MPEAAGRGKSDNVGKGYTFSVIRTHSEDLTHSMVL